MPKPYLRGEGNGMYGVRGEHHPSFRGGRLTDRNYNGPAWQEVMRQVEARDGTACQACGKEVSGYNRHLHHILPWRDYPEYRYDADNVVTLCSLCHGYERRKNRENIPEGVAKYLSGLDDVDGVHDGRAAVRDTEEEPRAHFLRGR